MVTHKLTLDVARDGIQGNIVLVKGERASRDISLTLRNGKNAIEFGEGYSAAIRGIKPDNTELFNSCVVYTNNGVYPNTIIYHITDQTVSVSGSFTVRLLIWGRTGGILWSPEFSITVKENEALDSDVSSQSEFTALIDAAVQAQNAARLAELVAEGMGEAVEEWQNEKNLFIEEHLKKANPHNITAKTVGLEKVDNTSDEDKPLSAAARVANEELAQAIDEAIEATSRALGVQRDELLEKIAEHFASTKTYADDTKVGKFGEQVIDGSLSISGNLLVEGDTFAKQIQSLEVGDAVIIANSDGVPLSELSGYVIRVSENAAYAIVYDPVNDCVKIGFGTYDGVSKKFTFGEGEAQPLATRAEIANGNIPVWDNENKTFRDSGIAANQIAKLDYVLAEFDELHDYAQALIGGEAQ